MRRILVCCLSTLVSMSTGCSSSDTQPQPPQPASRTSSVGQALELSSWTSTARAANPATGATTTLLTDGTLLVAGGNPSRLYRFDPTTNAAQDIGTLNEERTNHCATPLLDGRVLLMGGRDLGGAGGLITSELIKPQLNEVAAGPNLSAAYTTLVCARLRDGRVLIVGKEGQNEVKAEMFDPATDSLGTTGQPVASATSAFPSALMTLSSGKILLVSGTRVQLFDPSTETFSASQNEFGMVGPDVVGAVQSVFELPGGKVRLLGTGFCFSVSGGATGCEPAAHTYDPVTNTITRDGSFLEAGMVKNGSVLMPSGDVLLAAPAGAVKLYKMATLPAVQSAASLAHIRSNLAATLLPSGAAAVFGNVQNGAFGEPLETYWQEQDAVAGPSLDRVRIDATASTLPSGELLIAGGAGQCASGAPADVADTAVVFDPTAGVTKTIQLQSGRRAHVAISLDDGSVLLAGGTTSGSVSGPPATDSTAPLASAEIVTAAGSTATASMGVARRDAAAVRLPSGQVLVIGGEDENGPLASTELYDQAAGTFVAGPLLPFERPGIDAVVLTNGSVLVVADGAAAILTDVASGFGAIPAPGFDRGKTKLSLTVTENVLVTGADLNFKEQSPPSGELFDAGSGVFVESGAYAEKDTDERHGVQLLSGRWLFAGGRYETQQIPNTYLLGSKSVAVFDPATADGRGRFVAGADLPDARQRHVMALTSDGTVVIAGGSDIDPLTFGLKGCEVGLTSTVVVKPTIDVGPQPIGSERRPTLATSVTAGTAGEVVELTGTRLLGVRTALHGTVQASAGSVPVMMWRPASNQGAVRGRVEEWTDTSIKWRVPVTGLHGPGWLSVVVDGMPSVSVPFTITAADLGTRCTLDAQCGAGFCVDGVCCDTECDGVCEACTAELVGSGTDGTCGMVPPGRDINDLCVVPQGSDCGGKDDCLLGQFCVDGVCCDSACDGQCEACDADGSRGTCVPVLGAPHGDRPQCDEGSAAEPCQTRVCDGTARVTCAGFVGSEVACRDASCADGVETLAAACDGQGSCPSPTTNTCTPYVCGATACATPPCSNDDDCIAEYRCRLYEGFDYGECVVRQTSCDGSVVTTADGETIDCAPYVCDDTGCLENCDTASDCVAGQRCSAQRECVDATATTAAAGDDAGCGCRMAGGSGGSGGTPRHAGWLAFGVAAVVAGRSRRRRAR